MIIAVSSILHEADIIGQTITHLFKEGIDEVVISVGEEDEETFQEALDSGAAVTWQTGPFDQGAEITKLARAWSEDATWILPFDADEYWIGSDGRSIEAILLDQPSNIGKVYAATYPHIDIDHKGPQKPLSKVCFRPHPDMVVHWGNHLVSNVPGDEIHGILEVRELQYRSWEHFLAKVEKARALFASWDIPEEHGSHMRALTTLTTEQLQAEYQRLRNIPTTVDPIRGL